MIITQTFTMARWQIVVKTSEATKPTKTKMTTKNKQANKKQNNNNNNKNGRRGYYCSRQSGSRLLIGLTYPVYPISISRQALQDVLNAVPPSVSITSPYREWTAIVLGGCESRRQGFVAWTRQGERPELRSCVKVEVAVLGSPSLTVLMISVDVKQH